MACFNTHFATEKTLNKSRNGYGNAELHFQMVFSLSSTSSLLLIVGDAMYQTQDFEQPTKADAEIDFTV